MSSETNKERPLILVGPEGNMLRLQDGYQNPEKWETLETEDAVIMVARASTLQRRISLTDQISDYVDTHLAQRITLRIIAEHCGVSVSTITQLFQKKGTTFHQYLTQRRMNAAQQLIQAGAPLEEAGRLVGYTDHSTFYRAFRQTFGSSPREYRKKMESK